MKDKMILNRNNVERILKVLDLYEIDHFALIRENHGGIGYTLDLEFSHKLKDNTLTSRVGIVGPEDW